MTPLPKRRHSTRRQGKRAAAKKLIPRQLISCSHCQKQITAHTVCRFCGYYNNIEVIKPKIKKTPKKSS